MLRGSGLLIDPQVSSHPPGEVRATVKFNRVVSEILERVPWQVSRRLA